MVTATHVVSTKNLIPHKETALIKKHNVLDNQILSMPQTDWHAPHVLHIPWQWITTCNVETIVLQHNWYFMMEHVDIVIHTLLFHQTTMNVSSHFVTVDLYLKSLESVEDALISLDLILMENNALLQPAQQIRFWQSTDTVNHAHSDTKSVQIKKYVTL